MAVSPVNVALSSTTATTATTDSTGAYSYSTKLHAANWAVVRLVAQTTGFPTWSLFLDNALPLEYGVGPLASLGLILVPPGTQVTLVLTGGQPSAAVLGQYVGVMSPELREVLPFYIPSPNPVGSLTGSPTVLLGTVIAAANATNQQNFTLPVAAQAIRIALDFNGTNGVPGQILVTGLTTNDQYFRASTPNIGAGVYLVQVDSQIDPVVQVQISSQVGFPSKVWVSATLAAEAVATVTPRGEEAAVNLTEVAGNAISADFDNAGRPSVPVSQRFANPAGWQAPSAAGVLQLGGAVGPVPVRVAVSIAAGATATIVASAAGVSLYVHQFWGLVEGGIGATPELTVVDPTNTRSYHAHSFASAPAPPWTPRGARLTTGDGFAINNQDTAVHVIRGSLAYSTG